MLQNELFRARGTKAHCNSREREVQTLRCYPSLLKSPMKPLSDMAKTIIKLFMGRLKETFGDKLYCTLSFIKFECMLLGRKGGIDDDFEIFLTGYFLPVKVFLP